MTSEEQDKVIELRRIETLRCFLEHPKSSDKELEALLISKGVKTSSSTIGRDLASYKWIIAKFGKKVSDEVKEYRKENQHQARITGGKKSQELHSFSKDEIGKFTGSGTKNIEEIDNEEMKRG